MNPKVNLFVIFFLLLFATPLTPYPIDGYAVTGIRRLHRLELIQSGEIKGTIIPGALKSINDIQLHLLGSRGDSLATFPDPDSDLQKQIDAIFPNLHESYSIAILDISQGKKIRYADRQEDRGFQPGSVGKLAVITGFFKALENVYPYSFQLRQNLLRTKTIRAGTWALYDEHTVPFFDPETQKLFKRTVQANDVFSLYEWVDHMMSVSNNGAASVVWREAVLMQVFGIAYPLLTEEEAEQYFKQTPRATLTDIANAVVNEPLRTLGITEDEWRLGTFFTRGASAYIPGKGGSIGTPYGLMKWMVALERGLIVDQASSLEIKRLMYMTDRRIRYAASSSLKEAAVYFKSGSLYKCRAEAGAGCGKYRGNVFNYMNSVAIVEHPDGTTYLVALMSNVLRKNSANDHFALASRIDKIMREE